MLRQYLRNRRRQRRLAMIDVPDRPYVYVRLAAIKFFLAHDSLRVAKIQRPDLAPCSVFARAS
jgi:hypothetical protein